MKKILILSVFFMFPLQISDGYMIYPIYKFLDRVTDIIEATVLEKEEIKQIDTCLGGVIITRPSIFQYTLSVKASFQGKITRGSTIKTMFQEPAYHHYLDDSCKNVVGIWVADVFTGIEGKLRSGDSLTVYLKDERAYSQNYRIVAAVREKKRIDKFVIKFFKDLKYFHSITHKISSASAVGVNKDNGLPMVYISSELCFYEIDRVNEKIQSYKHDLEIEVDEWEPFFFEINDKKITLKSKNTEYILPLK